MADRSPLTLLVASHANGQAAAFFEMMGARAIRAHHSQAIDLIKYTPKLVVDAIVIDGTNLVYFPGMLMPTSGEVLRSAERLLKELLRQDVLGAMQNGILWSDLPIIVLVDEPDYATFTSAYPGNAKSVTGCKVPFRPLGAEDPDALPFGWDLIYDLILFLVKAWTFELVERMQMRGWKLKESLGIGQLYQSKRDDYDVARLAPKSIVLLPSDGVADETPISLVHWHEAIGAVIEELPVAAQIKAHVREYWFQRLFTENPYLLGAASFELVPHPHLVPDPDDPVFRRKQIPDFVRYATSSAFSALTTVEIKRADMPASALKRAVAQVSKATEFLLDPRYREVNRGLLAGVGAITSPLVIAGNSASKGFDLARSDQESVTVRPFDELASDALHRYTFIPSPDLITAYTNVARNYRPV